MHGWLIIDKPVGPGSTRIVSAVKRALREGGYPKVKVGHGGTLDPLASGVLPIALGEATKLSGRMLGADKQYEFTIAFGEETDTLDAEGQVVATSDRRPTPAEVEAVLSATGPIEQVRALFRPQGRRRAYASCRPKPQVTVHRSRRGKCCVTLAATVSKGTYIRSLARDIARALDTVGHVTMLRRTRAGPFSLDGAISLDKMSELAKARDLEQALLPLTAGAGRHPGSSRHPRSGKGRSARGAS